MDIKDIKDIKPGDRFRAEITCTHIRSGSGYDSPHFAIDLTTAEPIAPAKTPGQRAYESWRGNTPSAMPWASLRETDRAGWEKIAQAARK